MLKCTVALGGRNCKSNTNNRAESTEKWPNFDPRMTVQGPRVNVTPARMICVSAFCPR